MFWRGIKEVARSIIAHEPRLLIKRQEGLKEFIDSSKNNVRTWREKTAITSVVRLQDVYTQVNQQFDMALGAFPACRVMWIENSDSNDSVLLYAAPMVQALVHRPPLFHIHDHPLRSTVEELWKKQIHPPPFIHCTWHLVREEDYNRFYLRDVANTNWIVPMSLHDFKDMRDAFGDPSPFCNADAQIFPMK